MILPVETEILEDFLISFNLHHSIYSHECESELLDALKAFYDECARKRRTDMIMYSHEHPSPLACAPMGISSIQMIFWDEYEYLKIKRIDTEAFKKLVSVASSKFPEFYSFRNVSGVDLMRDEFLMGKNHGKEILDDHWFEEGFRGWSRCTCGSCNAFDESDSEVEDVEYTWTHLLKTD